MINLDLYLEQIQNNTEQMSAAGIGFSIDSPHTNIKKLKEVKGIKEVNKINKE